ncbi:MAG: DinB family protein [Actinomycetota bacterium]
MSERIENKDWSNAQFRNISFAGARMRDIDLFNAKISGRMDGLIINDIEIEPLMRREIERTNPERKKLFGTDPPSMRAGVDVVLAQLEATWKRALALAEAQRNQQVDEEWSVVETVRHLIFAFDAWIKRALLGEDDPFDPIALPPTFLPPTAPGMSCDPDAKPSFEDALAVWKDRVKLLNEIVDGLTPDELVRPIVTKGEGYPPPGHETEVIGPLWTVIEEIWWHNRFMNRDLDVLEGEA